MIDPEIAALDATLKAKGFSRADLGRVLGLDSKQLNRMFNGSRKLQLHEARKAEEWLNEVAPGRTGAPVLPMPGLVPLYGWVGAASEGRLTIAEQTIRGYVPMHPKQAHIRAAFALEVADVSMAPRYEPGEIVYVAPNRWPARGGDCVVVQLDGSGLLKRFIGRDHAQITLHQLNPESDFEVRLEDVSAVHAVVGRG